MGSSGVGAVSGFSLGDRSTAFSGLGGVGGAGTSCRGCRSGWDDDRGGGAGVCALETDGAFVLLGPEGP